MKKLIAIALPVISVIAIYSCNKEKDTLTTTAYLDLPATKYEYFKDINNPNEPMFDSLNRVATLGRVLFYDAHMSVNNAVACASCHKQELGFADNVSFSRGFEGKLTGRNSPGINRISSFGLLFWDGRERNLSNLIARPISNHVEMGVEDLNTLPAKLAALDYYKPLFKDAYKDENITLSRISDAVAIFVSSIGLRPSNKVVLLGGGGSSNTTELTPAQLKGKMLFDNVYNCGNCHLGGNGGYNGGDGRFMDIGLDPSYSDKGFGIITGIKTDIGRFKVPNLTNVALTAPYMHDGRYNTLDEVLEHYSHNISSTPNLDSVLMDKSGNPRRLNITESDKKSIILFLGSLTDVETNTDVKFSNPFKVK